MFRVECDGVSGSTAAGNHHVISETHQWHPVSLGWGLTIRLFHLCPHQAYDGPRSGGFSVLPGRDFHSSIFNMAMLLQAYTAVLHLLNTNLHLDYLTSSPRPRPPLPGIVTVSSPPTHLVSICIFLQTFTLCGSDAVTLRDLSPCRTGVDTPGQLLPLLLVQTKHLNAAMCCHDRWWLNVFKCWLSSRKIHSV